MGDPIKIVVRYRSGEVLKGTTQDFFPNRPSFHLLPQLGGAAIEVRSRDLKAVFFVKDFQGRSERLDIPGGGFHRAEAAGAHHCNPHNSQ